MLKLCLWNSLFKTWNDFCRQFQKRKKIHPSIITDNSTNTPFHTASSGNFTSGLIKIVTVPMVLVYFRKHKVVANQCLWNPPATPACCYLLTSCRLFSSTDDVHTAVTWLSKSVLPPPPPAFYYIDNRNFQDKSDLLQVGPGPQTLPTPTPTFHSGV